jgi:osmotically-inducible protein OsmY
MLVSTAVDRDIQQDVLDELDWDPEVDITDVGVEVDDGVVTLTGTVEIYAKKYAAELAAFRVDGVRAVANDIIVHVEGVGYRSDTDIAKAAATALELADAVPSDQIQIRVANGMVTLQGDVAWHYQRLAAEQAVRPLVGVRAVTNLIGVAEQPILASDVEANIKRAFVRHAELDADTVAVAVDGGHITLSGRVGTWYERNQAEQVAWKARGVSKVDNQIRIVPS